VKISNREYEQILQNIIQSDQTIRFAAICDKYGQVKGKISRKGLKLILNEFDTGIMVREAAGSWHYRSELSHKLGKCKFALAVYDVIMRLTLQLDQDHFLLLTLDNVEEPKVVNKIQKSLEKILSQ